MRRINSPKGLSLVEVTIMLLVLMLLTSVLAPSIMDFVRDAQWVKVKEDCEAIGISLSRLVRDVGPCLRSVASQPCTLANRVDGPVSDGTPAVYDSCWFGCVAIPALMTTDNWLNPAPANQDTMERQFVTNGAGYRTPAANFTTFPVGPQFNLGWRGAYLSPPIGPDPWGTRYYVNSGFLAVAIDAPQCPNEGCSNKWWEEDVFCVSAGPDRSIGTAFYSYSPFGTQRAGDDFATIISGSGR